MEFSVSEAFERDAIIAGAAIEGLRLFAAQKNRSSVELEDLQDVQTPGGGWVRSAPETVCGAEYNNDGYSPPRNTSAYCGPHCGPSASDKSFARKTWARLDATLARAATHVVKSNSPFPRCLFFLAQDGIGRSQCGLPSATTSSPVVGRVIRIAIVRRRGGWGPPTGGGVQHGGERLGVHAELHAQAHRLCRRRRVEPLSVFRAAC